MEQATTPLLPNNETPQLTGRRFMSRVLLGKPRTPPTVSWFIKSGFTKKERTAGMILIAVTIFDFLLSIAIIVYVI